jgi:hypothetical protein
MTSAANTSSVRRIAPLCAAFAVALALLFAGLLACTEAQARADIAGEGPPPAEQSLPSGEEIQWPPEVADAPPVAEEPSLPPTEAPPTEPAPAQTQEAEAIPQAGEEPVPAQAEAPPAEAPPPPPEAEAPPAIEEVPVAEAPALPEQPAEIVQQEEKPVKAPVAATGQETPVSSQSSTGAPATPAVSTSEPGAAPTVETSLSPTQVPITQLPPRRPGRKAATASCGLAAPLTTGCAVGWLGLTSQQAGSAALMIASGSFSARISGGEAEEAVHRRARIFSPPSSPTPSPQPGGSGGVSAACGGSSGACSAFTSAGVNLRYAQISTRAVILDQPSWRTSFFVLVPERPG